MKTNRNLLYLFVLGLFLFIITNINQYNESKINSVESNLPEHQEEIALRTSGYWSVSHIHVNGNWSATNTTYEWCYGKGTLTEPYIIENVTVDAGGVGSCIFIENTANYFLIRNCTCIDSGAGANAGIKLGGVINGKILSNTISDNYDGFYIYDSDNITLENNIVAQNNYMGFYLHDSDNITLENNVIVKNKNHGVLLDTNCDENQIINNNISENINNGIFLSQGCDENQILSNNISDIQGSTSGMGIRLSINCKNNTIARNIVEDNKDYGIELSGSNNNTISGNTVNYNKVGISLSSTSNNNTILGNILNNNSEYGIYLSYSNNDTVKENNMTECGLFIQGNILNQLTSHNITTTNKVNGRVLYYVQKKNGLRTDNFTNAGQVILINCNNSLISGLDVSRGTAGISLFYCMNNTISGNNASYNNYYGIYVYYSNNNTVAGTNASYCNYGIYITSSNNNTVAGTNASFCNYGIYITSSNKNTIAGTNASYCNSGIYLISSNNNTIVGNHASYNTNRGISLYSNCNNNTITGNIANKNKDFGIDLYSSDNNEISGNFANNNNNSGIYLVSDCKNNQISGNIANNNLDSGIYLSSSNNNEISGNTMIECGLYIQGNLYELNSYNITATNKVNGRVLYYYVNKSYLRTDNFTNAGQVILINCNNSLISGLNVSHGSNGISLFYGNNNSISGNNASFCNDYGIYMYSINNTKIWGNNASYSNDFGIYLSCSYQASVNNNTIAGNDVRYSTCGIYLSYGKNNTIAGNNASFNIDYGIYIVFSNNNTIVGNNASYSNYGIFVYGCNNNTIEENNASYSKYGIFVFYSNNNTISNNIIIGTPDLDDDQTIGIDLNTQSKNNQIVNNELKRNGIGILLEDSCNNNSFYTNRIIDNKKYGVSISNLFTESQSNLFVENIFNNPFGINAIDNCSYNLWNDQTQGNWWHDYNGADANDNGIGDTPYSISGTGNARDNKPIGKFVPSLTDDDDDDNKGDQQPDNNCIIIIIILVIGAALVTSSYGVYRSKKSKQAKTISKTPSDKRLKIKAPEIKQSEIKPTIPAVELNELSRKKGLEPSEVKKQKVPSKGTEHVVDLTEEERREVEKTESEMGVDKQQFICIVHKGPIIGANYLCPHCQTFYCVKCAKTLKEKGEKCWSCDKDIEL